LCLVCSCFVCVCVCVCAGLVQFLVFWNLFLSREAKWFWASGAEAVCLSAPLAFLIGDEQACGVKSAAIDKKEKAREEPPKGRCVRL
jgi:hypothetical protein